METNTSAVPFGVGQVGKYKRGVNESGSIYTWFGAGAKTVSAVPYARITSVYWLERAPRLDKFLCGDYENEFTYIGLDLPTRRIAGKEPSGSNESDTWLK